MSERRPVAGSPGYFVSLDGECFGPRGKMTGSISEKGYLRVNIKGKSPRLHRLVAQAFLPNEGNLPEVNHKDGSKLNNSAGNLEWCTRAVNMQHAFSTGLCRVTFGENAPAAKLKDSDLSAIRAAYVPRFRDFSYAALGKKYGVDQSRIHQIVRGA